MIHSIFHFAHQVVIHLTTFLQIRHFVHEVLSHVHAVFSHVHAVFRHVHAVFSYLHQDLRHRGVTIAASAAVLLTIPAVLELLLVTLGSLRPRLLCQGGPGRALRLAAVVPAYNEEALVAACVTSILRSAGPACTVVVVADNCTDCTAERATEAGARVLVRTDAQRRGKGYALRFAFKQLMKEGFDSFLIVDADSVVSRNFVREMARGLAAGADAVQARYRVARPSDSLHKRLMDVALLAFNVVRPRGRDAWGLSAGICGNGFGLSGQTLVDVPYSAESIVEDLEYHLLLVSSGKRVRFADRATVYGAMPDAADAQSSQRARWEGGRLRVAKEWIPKLAAKILRGRLAAVEPLLEVLTLPLVYLGLLSLLLCALRHTLFRWYGAGVLALILAHVVSATALGEDFRQSLTALLAAPLYAAWKLTTLPSVLRSSSGKAEWVRTQRNSSAI